MPISGKEMVKKYLKAGWILVRVSGSHHQMEKNGRTIPIPVHGNNSLGKGLEQKLLKALQEDN